MPTTSTTVETNSFTFNDFPPTETPSNDISIQCDNNHTSPRNTFYHSLLSCVSSLYGNPTIPRNCVQHVVKHLQQLFEEGVTEAFTNFTQHLYLQNEISHECRNSVNNLLNAFIEPLQNLDTEHKRFREFTRQGTYIAPIQIVFGDTLKRVKERGQLTLRPSPCTAQFIPLRNVLKCFFSLDGVLTEVLQFVSKCSSDVVLTNFCQGTVWKHNIRKSHDKVVLPLVMFFDDFETGNVLGSYAGIYKLGAVYVSVGTVPPYRSATLSNIFLTLLFHSADRNVFGNKIIFRPLIEEFNYLRETGVHIDTLKEHCILS